MQKHSGDRRVALREELQVGKSINVRDLIRLKDDAGHKTQIYQLGSHFVLVIRNGYNTLLCKRNVAYV